MTAGREPAQSVIVQRHFPTAVIRPRHGRAPHQTHKPESSAMVCFQPDPRNGAIPRRPQSAKVALVNVKHLTRQDVRRADEMAGQL